ncbi:uncharacterized protein [Haliotis asinina]|uniref:uncharacterized protein n=1 Tax=Haliotis asinina TaxID=109174 RepID=UPI003531875E
MCSSIVAGCEAFGLYPYPSLFGFVPPPPAPRNPIPRNTTPTPWTVTPEASTPQNKPDANPLPNPPNAKPPPNMPDVKAPPNIPDVKPPPKTPHVKAPPKTPDADPPLRVPSSSPNGGSKYPLYGRGTQRTFSPFPGRSGWGGLVNRYKPPPPPPESSGFQYTPPVPPDTAQDAQDFEEPYREWVYHYRGTRTETHPERMSIAGNENEM